MPVISTFLLPHPCRCSLARASHPFPVSERGGRTFHFCPLQPLYQSRIQGPFREELPDCCCGAVWLMLSGSFPSVKSDLSSPACCAIGTSACPQLTCLPTPPSTARHCRGKTVTCYCFLPTASKQRPEPWCTGFVSRQNQEGALGFQQTWGRPPWLVWRAKSSTICWEVEEHSLRTEGQRFKMLLQLTETSKMCLILPPQRSAIASSCLACRVIYCSAWKKIFGCGETCFYVACKNSKSEERILSMWFRVCNKPQIAKSFHTQYHSNT